MTTDSIIEQVDSTIAPRSPSWQEMVASAEKRIAEVRDRGAVFEVEWHKQGQFYPERVCTLIFDVDQGRSA